LTKDYCGFFEVNEQEKKISTMTKSGCCWHQYSDFIVKNNNPKKVRVVTEEYSLKEDGETLTITTEKLINGA
jgi:hypothetical protein